eukprot:2936395-Amphidinium_carterae.1
MFLKGILRSWTAVRTTRRSAPAHYGSERKTSRPHRSAARFLSICFSFSVRRMIVAWKVCQGVLGCERHEDSAQRH